ncbi:hypothetical protein BJ138DRAFT_1104049 [Hygrophoropsis aurantiaca]|uniref:Uncharacterized protein n=1 Tax=Hygrophoropsis aurantiaca TaxID=72124 RepID=A0ACB8A346_9AGAM|nr:hypothetical protein BJ138DRAFT_1104049 [Hygrophoropsis aurantiaca]
MPPSRFHLWHIAVILTETVFLAFGWGFLAALLYFNYIPLPNYLASLIHRFPSESTLVVTVIATMLAMAATFCLFSGLFTIAIKDALRHRMAQPISLITLATGIALTKGTHIWKPRSYLGRTALTWLVYAVLTSLTAGWTTLLAPTFINVHFQMSGIELDVSGIAFSNLLGQELKGAAVETGITFGLPGIFNFNGPKYNLSTGGVVPAVSDYAGSVDIPDQMRLSFDGGQVSVNVQTEPDRLHGKIPSGFSTNYTVFQQGLTANVTCAALNPNDNSDPGQLSLTNPYISLPVQANDSSIAFYLRQWNSTANCVGGSPTVQSYVTRTNASNQPDLLGSGFLPAVVCPGTNSSAYQRFVIVSQGFYRYDFLPPTVCEITPLVTNVTVKYSGGLINIAQTISSRPFESDNANLLRFISGVMSWQARNAQGLMGNTIGDSLFAIHSATSNQSITSNTAQVYDELEDYWRGIVEFTATFLRSGFSASGSFPQNQIPANMTAKVTGNMVVSTVGWAGRVPTYFLAVIPVTTVAVLTFIAIAYSSLASGGFGGGGLPHWNEGTTVRLAAVNNNMLGLVEDGYCPKTDGA